jgi:hypothetical protein
MTTVDFIGSPTPGLHAGVWLQQLLAESLHGILASNYQQIAVDCARNELGLADLARILGGFAAQRLPPVGDEEKTLVQDREKALKFIWDDFLKENRIQKLSRNTRDLLKSGSAETKQKLQQGKFDFSWLEQAHTGARRFIDEFLKSRALEGMSSVPAVKVFVVEDREGRMFCARTQAERGQILWAHQNVAHALTNMLVAERVLAHEYLSHVLPRNGGLGRAVTEQWLVALLQDLYERRKGEPYWPRAIFRTLRHDLEEHVAGKAANRGLEMIRSLGVRGVESAASDLFENAPERFWRFTDELLTIPVEEDVEQVLLDLMVYFAVAGPDAVEAALTRKYSNIRELHKALAL